MRVINGLVYVILLVLFFQGMRKKQEAVGFYFTKYGYLLVVLAVFNTLSFAMSFRGEEAYIFIEREGYAGGEQSIGLSLKKGEEEWEERLKVQCQQFTDEERKEKMQAAFAVMEQTILGENASFHRIESDLDFSLDQTEFPFDVDFIPENYRLINGDGYVKNEKSALLAEGYTAEDLQSGIATKVTVTLWYGEESEKREYGLTVFPRRKTESEQLFEAVMEGLKKTEQEGIYQKELRLPGSVDGVTISRLDKGGLSPAVILLGGVIFAVLLFLREKENERQEEKRQEEKLRRCYPWFVNEMVLLLGAGMQVKHIFSTMIAEYRENESPGDDRVVLVTEIIRARHGMDNGVPESQVYYQLGRRLKLPCYIKLMTLLEQNVTRGTKGMTGIFEAEEMAALEERKNLAKRYGEEAGTKLLAPMILLLLVVMLMIMVPAFMSFS